MLERGLLFQGVFSLWKRLVIPLQQRERRIYLVKGFFVQGNTTSESVTPNNGKTLSEGSGKAEAAC